MEFIAGLVLGAVICFFLMKNDKGLEKPNGRKDFGGQSGNARYETFVLEHKRKFRTSRISDPIVLSYFFHEASMSMTRVVRLVRSGNTTVFDEERSVISFREFQGFLNTLFSFPGVSFEEAENRARFFRV